GENLSGSMAGELGFEPRLTESESAVLPLNYSPLRRRGAGYLTKSARPINGFDRSAVPFSQKARALNAPSPALLPSDRRGSHKPLGQWAQVPFHKKVHSACQSSELRDF